MYYHGNPLFFATKGLEQFALTVFGVEPIFMSVNHNKKGRTIKRDLNMFNANSKNLNKKMLKNY